MKIKLPLGLLLLMAGALGYLLGTENGRAQRDVILVKLGRKQADEEQAMSSEEASS